MKPERIKELPQWIDRIRELIYLMEEVQRHREPEISPAAAQERRGALIVIFRRLRMEKHTKKTG